MVNLKFVSILILSTLPHFASAFTLASTTAENKWPGESLTFYLNPTNCPADVSNALNAALDAWSDVPSSGMKLKFGGVSNATPAALIGGTASPSPVIVCDPAFSTNSPSADPNFVGGYGFSNTNGAGTSTYGGIVLNVQSGKGGDINNYSTVQLKLLLAHEMGHVLGFGHSEYQPALMYYSLSGKTDFSLSQDDEDAMAYLYPRDEFKDGLYGCGRVEGASLPPGTKWAALFLMLIPLMMLIALRGFKKTV